MWARIQHLPDRSATAKAKREGDWSDDQYVAARIANTLTYFRADHAAVNGEKMSVEPLESPRQQAERAERDRHRRDVGSMLRAQLRGEYTPPPRAVTFESTDLTPTLGGADG